MVLCAETPVNVREHGFILEILYAEDTATYAYTLFNVEMQ